jgi:hypothetical protein
MVKKMFRNHYCIIFKGKLNCESLYLMDLQASDLLNKIQRTLREPESVAHNIYYYNTYTSLQIKTKCRQMITS